MYPPCPAHSPEVNAREYRLCGANTVHKEKNRVPNKLATRVGTLRLGILRVTYGVKTGTCHREYRSTAPAGANATLHRDVISRRFTVEGPSLSLYLLYALQRTISTHITVLVSTYSTNQQFVII
jgi:hypothetical protein